MTPDFVDPQPDLATSSLDYDPDDLDHALAMVDEDDDEEDDNEEIDEVEREMQRLTRERGFGLGSLVDRVLGWTLFENNDDDPTAPGNQKQNLSKTRSELETTDEMESKGKEAAGSDDPDLDGSMKDEKEDVIREAGKPRDGEEGEYGWDDAVWLAKVVGKIVS